MTGLSSQDFAEHVRASFALADARTSRLPPEVLLIPGMTGDQTRHLYNNLCNFSGCTYLEIGCWAGSSTVSALHGNDAAAIVIDDWSEFGGPKDEFYANVRTHLRENVVNKRIVHVDSDCWEALANMEHAEHAKFSVYLYDAGHNEEDHRRAITEAYACLQALL